MMPRSTRTPEATSSDSEASGPSASGAIGLTTSVSSSIFFTESLAGSLRTWGNCSLFVRAQTRLFFLS